MDVQRTRRRKTGVRAADLEPAVPGALAPDLHRSHAAARLAEPARVKALLLCVDFPPEVGGIQTMLGSLAAELTPWDLTVVAPWWPGATAFDQVQPYRVARVR